MSNQIESNLTPPTIQFPQGIDTKQLHYLVRATHEKPIGMPLRYLVSRFIKNEGQELWKDYVISRGSSYNESIAPDKSNRVAIYAGYLSIDEIIGSYYSSEDIILSNRIDPSGLDHLVNKYRFWEHLFGSSDPGMIGMKRGIERFKYVYASAVKHGAIRDVDRGGVDPLIVRTALRIRRQLQKLVPNDKIPSF